MVMRPKKPHIPKSYWKHAIFKDIKEHFPDKSDEQINALVDELMAVVLHKTIKTDSDD